MGRFGIKNSWHEALVEWPVLVNFSLPAFLTTMISGPVYWGCNALLANQPDGYNELGIIAAANQWGSAVAFLPGLITVAAFPVLSERFGATDSVAISRIMNGMIKLTALVLLPLIIMIGLLSPLIMRGYGETFEKGYLTLILTLLAVVPQTIVAPCWYVLMAGNRMWICFLMNCGWSVITLIATFYLLPCGSAGVAGARLISFVVHGCWIYGYIVWVSNKEMKHKQIKVMAIT
jgi:O-antigen/teichoic acid export membrane protein